MHAIIAVIVVMVVMQYYAKTDIFFFHCIIIFGLYKYMTLKKIGWKLQDI